jgi:hypothetical protein
MYIEDLMVIIIVLAVAAAFMTISNIITVKVIIRTMTGERFIKRCAKASKKMMKITMKEVNKEIDKL